MEAERKSRRWADTIIARLTEASAALAERPREITAPEKTIDTAEDWSEPAGSQRDAQEPKEEEETPRRPWWLRRLWG